MANKESSEISACSIKPPKNFIINASHNLAEDWKLWLQQFNWFAIASNLELKKPEVKVAVFMSSIGTDAAIIFNTFNLNEQDSKNLEVIKKRFTNHFTHKLNETYERYMFNLITQKEGQSFDEFLTNLKSEIKYCAYGSLEDSIIRDRVVIGIYSDAVREKLLAESGLNLQRTIDICHSAEQVKIQIEAMQQAPVVETLTFNKKKEIFHCQRCDTKHVYRACPAFRKVEI